MKREPSSSAISIAHPERIRVGIVHSTFYTEEIQSLIDGARETLLSAGLDPKNISLHAAPGSWEVPLIGAVLAKKKAVDALIGFGIIIEGKTHHAELLAREAARGMMDVQVKEGIPFAFEILYVDSLELVRARLDKGKEAAFAVLQALKALQT